MRTSSDRYQHSGANVSRPVIRGATEMRRPFWLIGIMAAGHIVLAGAGIVALRRHGSASPVKSGPDRVTLWHLPSGAIQPQAAVDSRGIVHVIYFRNGATDGAGDLYYVRMSPGQASPSEPIRVNSQKDSA